MVVALVRGDTSTDVDRGTGIVRDGAPATPEEMLALARRLADAQQFGLARKLLRRARDAGLADPDDRAAARQQHALCTYKDPDAPVAARLRRALEILGDGEDLATTADAETLGIAGAIHKRRWEATMRVAELERALHYYHRGYRQGLGEDGYAAINTAFVLDLLADAESSSDLADRASDAAVAARHAESDAIRREIVAQLGPLGEQRPLDWWLQATLAEACLGLADYPAAKRWLARCRQMPDVAEWRIESTSRQLGALAMLRARQPGGTLDPGAREALEALLGDRQDAVVRAYAGKLGIALSGGGFRASFFHIGVLAHLAEIDALRHVEVLSCVSGGSLVGAHYYLEVQQLLKTQAESAITRDEYVGIVERMEREFLAGVESNIRMRVVGNALSNLWSIVAPAWTRTRYAGRLYERKLYARVADSRGRDPRYMDDLLIAPHGEDERDDEGKPRFSPKRDNWRRRCKVPILVLNATTLNTGHNWQFTASWMGEPPPVVDEDVDANPRLRRMYYEQAPERWRRVRLGEAVAASACVPGLFDPLVLAGLYEDTRVELVDGGVHDNQGVATLVEQECSVMLVSDASGQMGHLDMPGRGPVAVPLRSSSILSARVRESQLRDLLARRSSSALRGLGVIHLRKGLTEPPRDWVDCPDPYLAADDVLAGGEPDGYGVPPDVQALLARVRTDLDAFSELEAHALMLSGYRMAQHSFGPALADFPTEPAAAPGWKFLAVDGAVNGQGPEHDRLKRVLAVGAGRWGKVWRLSRPLRWAGTLAAAAAVVALLWGLWQARSEAILTPGALLAAVAIAAVVTLGARLLRRRADPLGTTFRVGVGLLLVAAAIPAWLQIHLLDPVYRHAGRLRRG